MRVAFTTLGCKVNQAESDTMRAQLPPGVRETVPSEADLVVINTCTVTGEADRKVRKAIHQALALPQEPIVVVTGCLAVVDPEAMVALSERVVVVPDKTLVPARIAALAGESGADSAETGAAETPGREVPRARRGRVAVKVQDGCDTGCSYCIIPTARGVPRSVPAREVVAHAERLALAGVREIVLTGITIGAYDDSGLRLPGLLLEVAATGIPRIRVSSVEPGDVTEEFLEVTADLDAFCRHLHVPLQSGSDRTLARMRRPYDTAAFTAMLQRVEDRLPGVAVTTDVIVGFPGETDADAAESLAFVRDSSFARLHVFRYSPRAGTDAAGLPGRVPPPIAAQRAAAMRACGEDLQRAWAAARMGATAEVLIERASSQPDGTIHAEGTTREYERVRFPVPSERTGALAIVTLGARGDDGVVTASPARPGSMSVVESGR